jgi:phosphoribosylformylglycinamidine cyclo-ligase
VPAIFEIIGREGKVARDEMYQVFNMGIGMVLIVSEMHAAETLKQTKGRVIGRIVPGKGVVQLR